MDKQNLLLIAPLFFNYYKEMVKEAEELGYCVDYICDAPSDSNLSKAIGRINKKLIKGSAHRYFSQIVLPIIEGHQYDCVLLVAGMTCAFDASMMQKIRELNPNARFVMYQWDSEKNLPYAPAIHPFFDQLYSFDLNDCESMDKYTFLPLFYTRIYEEIGSKPVESYQYDCSYVGTAHPQKFRDINAMSAALKEIMPRQFIYHYMPSKLKFLYHKLLAPEFRNAKMSDFKTEKLDSKQMMKVIEESGCILDAPQAGQTGLTIRTIECLGAKRKLITTNADVMRYDFYDPRNVLVFDGDLKENDPFFGGDYVPVDEGIYRKYSLREWLGAMMIRPQRDSLFQKKNSNVSI